MSFDGFDEVMLAMVRPRIALAEDNKKKSILNKMLFWK